MDGYHKKWRNQSKRYSASGSCVSNELRDLSLGSLVAVISARLLDLAVAVVSVVATANKDGPTCISGLQEWGVDPEHPLVLFWTRSYCPLTPHCFIVIFF